VDKYAPEVLLGFFAMLKNAEFSGRPKAGPLE